MILATISRLIAAGLSPTAARTFAEPLATACGAFNIDTPARIAGFVAQCRVESSDFTRLEEGLYYTTPERILAVFPSRVRTLEKAASLARNPKALANCVYAGRLGNGDEFSGDGWRFRGRGLIQLTGRANYAAASQHLAVDYLVNPDAVALPADACLTAAWFWHSRGCNALADAGRWDDITRAVNGPGMLHATERRRYSEEGANAFA